MTAFAAGYLGGDPGVPKPIEEGVVEAFEGGLRFRHQELVNMLVGHSEPHEMFFSSALGG